MTAEDFVDVKLSAAGEAMASGPELAPGENYSGESSEPCVRINGGYEYLFQIGKTVRLTAGEFRARLQAMTYQGESVFEIVPPAEHLAVASQSDAATIERS
jgi:hypothetical protein